VIFIFYFKQKVRLVKRSFIKPFLINLLSFIPLFLHILKGLVITRSGFGNFSSSNGENSEC
jgi:hypothetical protein